MRVAYICVTYFLIIYRTDDRYLLGSKEPLTIDVSIANRGEDAFEAGFYMTLPPGLNLRKVEQSVANRDTLVTCTPPTAATNNTLKCDIGNPLPAGKVVSIFLITILFRVCAYVSKSEVC